MFSKKFLLTFLFITACFSVFAQSISEQIDHYHLQDGLSDRWVNDAFQDKNGFIWFATKNGLNRFNGYKFKVYGDQIDQETQFINSDILSLASSNDENIWLATADGISKFNPNNLSVSNFDLKNIFLEKARIEKIFITQSNSLFALCNNRIISALNVENPDFKILERIKQPIFNIIQNDKKNEFWAIGKDSLYHISSEKKINVYKVPIRLFHKIVKDKRYISPSYFPLILKEKYIYSNHIGVVLKFNLENKTFSIDSSLNYKNIKKGELILSSNQFWIYRFKPSKGLVFLLIDKKSNQKTVLESILPDFSIYYRIHNIFIDNFKNLWILTNNGVYKIPFKSNLFDILFKKNNELNSIRGLYQSKSNKIFITSRDYIYTLNPDKTFDKIKLNRTSNLPPYKIINTNQDTISFFYHTNEVHHLNIKTNQKSFTRLEKENPFLKPIDFKFQDLEFLTNGSFGIGKMLIYSKKKKKLFQFKDYSGNYNFENIKVNKGFWLNKNQICLLSNDGLFFINSKLEVEKHFTFYQKNQNKKIELYSSHITNEGIFWLGTNNNGLIKFNPINESYKFYTTKNGLSNNLIYSILSQNDSVLWMGTNYGLSKMHIEKESFDNFYEEDGLPHHEFNKESYLIANNGAFYLGTLNGLISFHPEKIKLQTNKPSISLSKISLFDKEKNKIVELVDLNNIKKIELSSQNKFLNIEYFINNYVNSKQNKYAYYLEGYDNDWIYNGTNNSLRYDNIPAGNYLLKIKGSDANGLWSKNTIEIPVKVNEVFYKSYWFIILCFSVLGILVFIFNRYRLKQKLQKLKELDFLRVKIASDLHDEVGGLLAKIAMKMEFAQYEKKYEDDNFFSKIVVESRKAMQLMSDVIWSIDTRKDSIDDMIYRMKAHALEMFENQDLNYYFHIENLDLNKKITPEIRHNIYLIYKECINNIAKHAQASEVNISLKNTERGFEMKIQDNGIGLKKNTMQKGQGQSNLKMRAQKIKGEITIESKNGVEITLTSPTF